MFGITQFPQNIRLDHGKTRMSRIVCINSFRLGFIILKRHRTHTNPQTLVSLSAQGIVADIAQAREILPSKRIHRHQSVPKLWCRQTRVVQHHTQHCTIILIPTHRRQPITVPLPRQIVPRAKFQRRFTSFPRPNIVVTIHLRNHPILINHKRIRNPMALLNTKFRLTRTQLNRWVFLSTLTGRYPN